MAKIHDMDGSITAEIVCRLIKPDETPKYLVGTNSFAETAFHHLEKSNVTVKGFINLFTKQETFCQVPVIHSLSQVEKNAIVLNCVVELGSCRQNRQFGEIACHFFEDGCRGKRVLSD